MTSRPAPGDAQRPQSAAGRAVILPIFGRRECTKRKSTTNQKKIIKNEINKETLSARRIRLRRRSGVRHAPVFREITSRFVDCLKSATRSNQSAFFIDSAPRPIQRSQLKRRIGDSPVDEGALRVQQVELVVETGPRVHDGRRVGNHAHRALHGGQVAARNDRRRLVVDAHLQREANATSRIEQSRRTSP